jgi:RNA polymerase sigma-70 factor, ECF subfamily
VRRARRGDRDALELLLRGHYDRIHAVCRRITGNPADAADAAQNALIAVTRGLARFDDRSRFSSWAYRIAVNCSIDEIRRRSRARMVSLDELSASGGDGAAGPSAGAGDPETAATRVDVDAALRRLPVEFRAPVVLRDMCGLDYAEIAEILQVPAGTVRSRIARGRAALVRLMEPSGSEP